MKKTTCLFSPVAVWAAAFLFMFGLAPMARATLLVYEPFNYTAGANLAGQNGGTGFDGSSSWSTLNSGAGSVAIKQDGVVSGVLLSDSVTANPYSNTYSNLPDSGNFVGPSNGVPNGSTAPDHISMSRLLDSTVPATFVDGTKTYFSFTSARAFNTNSRAPTLTIGQGYTTTAFGNRGDSVSAGPNGSQAIGVGGNTAGAGSAANNYAGATINGVAANVGMVGMYLPQAWNSSGTRTIGPATGGGAFSSVLGTGPLPGDHAYWMQGGGGVTSPGSLLYGYSSTNTPVSGYGDNQSHVNIIVGEIEWGAGTGGTDLLSYYVFHDLDPLTETAFDAGKSTWDTLQVTAASRASNPWNVVGIAGGRYFVDEIRIATTFNEAVGAAPVPEPSSFVLAGLGLAGLVALKFRRKRA